MALKRRYRRRVDLKINKIIHPFLEPRPAAEWKQVISKLSALSPEQLLKLAVILHDCYHSYDVAAHYLAEYDRRTGTDYYRLYLAAVTSVPAMAAAAT